MLFLSWRDCRHKRRHNKPVELTAKTLAFWPQLTASVGLPKQVLCHGS
jgi:hypothetical protein